MIERELLKWVLLSGCCLPRLSLESCKEEKKLRRLGESRLRWNSLIRELSPAFNGVLFWEKVNLLLHASTPIGNSPLPNSNHQTTTGLGCPLPRRLSTLQFHAIHVAHASTSTAMAVRLTESGETAS